MFAVWFRDDVTTTDEWIKEESGKCNLFSYLFDYLTLILICNMFVFTDGMVRFQSGKSTHKRQKQDLVQKKRLRHANGLDDDAAEGAHGESEQSKIRGASLTEMFTPCQLEAHVATLKQWVGETKPKVDEKRAMGECKNDYACQLCGVEKLFSR
ncbi:hypothetical protein C5167_024711 [Papaver somniferum]|uniref:Uncharacterized protein n=1 Tax=Papaver somniferum TaxID=3469 RepID=A0A4Y7JPD5_PAPSO|nr:hypothetical protein C5167_024711 [Papaver somniferum]